MSISLCISLLSCTILLNECFSLSWFRAKVLFLLLRVFLFHRDDVSKSPVLPVIIVALQQLNQFFVSLQDVSGPWRSGILMKVELHMTILKSVIFQNQFTEHGSDNAVSFLRYSGPHLHFFFL